MYLELERFQIKIKTYQEQTEQNVPEIRYFEPVFVNFMVAAVLEPMDV